MNKDSFTVGGRIKQARKDSKLTQLKLSEMMDVSRAAVGQWEINTTTPDVFKIERLANILKTDPSWLAFGPRTVH